MTVRIKPQRLEAPPGIKVNQRSEGGHKPRRSLLSPQQKGKLIKRGLRELMS